MKKQLFLFLFLIASALSTQSQIRLMSYNMLNFPTGNLAGRTDTLSNIVDFYQPHLLMIQELETAQGLQGVTDMMNTLGYGSFAHSTFIAQQSDPGSGNPLQHAIVFDQNIFQLKSDMVVTTDIRDVNGFELFLNDEALAQGADTTFLWVFVTHLKSSEGNANEQLRLAMINDWLAAVEENLPEDSNVILAGDFNLYSNSEPAYTTLMDGSNYIRMIDPLEGLGNWSGSGFAHKEILTQSTRLQAIFNDGAGGGIDDRFDFIVFSENLMDEANPLHYVSDSWYSLGNNGDCYNESITGCSGGGNPVPADVLQSMYYMSDHIPQVCELAFSGTLPDNIILASGIEWKLLQKGNVVSDELLVSLPSNPGDSVQLRIFGNDGRIVYETQIGRTNTNSTFFIPVEKISPGFYHLVVSVDTANSIAETFLIQRP